MVEESKQTLQAIPAIILPSVERTTGKDAQKSNILAGRAVADVIRTTLGPKGMDKMLVGSLGDVVLTNDGVTILDEMDIEHPVGKMMVEVAKTQQNEIGDGTTTAVILAGELLKKAEGLLEQLIHPTIIVKGFRISARESQRILDQIGEPISLENKDLLLSVATTAMTGKSSEGQKEFLGKLVLDAINIIVEKKGEKIFIDRENIKIEKKQGAGINESQLIRGILLDKERVHSGMPKHVKNAKIALLTTALEIKKTETDAEIQIESPDVLKAFLDEEEDRLKEMVHKIKTVGANVVLCQKGIDDMAQHYLAKEGIFAVRRIKKSDMEKLAKATGGRLITTLEDLQPEYLGWAATVEEVTYGEDEMVLVRGCKNPKAISLFLRGGSEHVIDEIERSVKDAIEDVISALTYGKVVAGGGASELEISQQLKEFAKAFKGKEQLAINAFADALEICPKTLAENAGADPGEILVTLRAQHESKDRKWYGVNVFDRKADDMWKKGVIEPLALKAQAIKSATEVAEMLLRIDDVVVAKEISKEKGGPTPPGGEEFE
jgi:thermosome